MICSVTAIVNYRASLQVLDPPHLGHAGYKVGFESLAALLRQAKSKYGV